MLEAARRRGRASDHVLLSGPPGLGKTTLAMIIAHEMSTPLRVTSGPAITHAGDLAAILSGLNDGDVLFVDEIHRMSRPAEEMLYLAMEDFRVDVVIGKGPGATAIPLEIPPFTLVGATTRAGLLPGPLRDRFGFTAQLEFYEPDELDTIIRRSAGLLGVEADAEGTRRDRLPLARHAPDRQPAAAPGPRLRPGPRRRRGHPRHRPRRPRPLRGRRARPRPARPGRPRRPVPPLRRRPGRHLDPRGRRRRGARDGRGGRRAVPGPQRLPGPYAAWPGRDAGRLGAPRPDRATGPADGPSRRTSRCSSPEVWVVATHPVTLHLRSARPASRRPAPAPSPSRRTVVSNLVPFLPLVGIALLFWLLFVRPAQRRQRAMGSMQRALAVG